MEGSKGRQKNIGRIKNQYNRLSNHIRDSYPFLGHATEFLQQLIVIVMEIPTRSSVAFYIT